MATLTNDNTGARVPPSPLRALDTVAWPGGSQGRQRCWDRQDSLTVEAVHLGDLPALMVAPQQRDTVRPLGF